MRVLLNGFVGLSVGALIISLGIGVYFTTPITYMKP